MNFDIDDNGYLKKAEFVEAAKAFTAGGRKMPQKPMIRKKLSKKPLKEKS